MSKPAGDLLSFQDHLTLETLIRSSWIQSLRNDLLGGLNCSASTPTKRDGTARCVLYAWLNPAMGPWQGTPVRSCLVHSMVKTPATTGRSCIQLELKAFYADVGSYTLGCHTCWETGGIYDFEGKERVHTVGSFIRCESVRPFILR